jgi:prefoldin subunit 5
MEEKDLKEQLIALTTACEMLRQEQQAIRKLLQELDLSDDTIGRAAERYARKMAVVRGGN